MKKPILIDELLNTDKKNEAKEIDGKWYIAKDLSFKSIGAFFERVYHAWLVILDKARAYRYKEDD